MPTTNLHGRIHKIIATKTFPSIFSKETTFDQRVSKDKPSISIPKSPTKTSTQKMF